MSASISAVGREVDVVVIGSGFGGAVTACRLAQAGRSVVILERGKEYPTGRGEMTATGHGTDTVRHGHFQVDRGTNMNVIRGIGVGGGSLHYFGVRLRTPADVFHNGRWPKEVTREVLDPYYDLAGDMLKAAPLQPNPVLGVPTRSTAFLEAARQARRTRDVPSYVPIAVNTSAEPEATKAGVPQTPCVFCGECVIGCPPSESFNGNVNARALLTLNYLAVAQTHGAGLFAEHLVNRIRQDGDGFEVEVTDMRDPTHWEIGVVRAKQVVLGAGTMGSTEILLKSQQTLPPLSPMLGQNFSANGDFLIPKTTDTPQDLQPTSGPTITVGADFSTSNNRIYIEDLGRIPFLEAVVGTDKDIPIEVKRHEIGYLGMGSDAGNGVLSILQDKVHLDWNPQQSLGLYNEIISALRELSQKLGGNYRNPLKYDPQTGAGLTTAHPLGGCVMGDTPQQGVVNPRGEVYGVPGLFVADGACVPSAVIVNPSYTITAIAERVAFWMIHGREMAANDSHTPANN